MLALIVLSFRGQHRSPPKFPATVIVFVQVLHETDLGGEMSGKSSVWILSPETQGEGEGRAGMDRGLFINGLE